MTVLEDKDVLSSPCRFLLRSHVQSKKTNRISQSGPNVAGRANTTVRDFHGHGVRGINIIGNKLLINSLRVTLRRWAGGKQPRQTPPPLSDSSTK